MNRTLLGIMGGAALGAGAMWVILKHHENTGHSSVEEPAEESHVVHTNGQTFVKLDLAAGERAGLKTEPLAAATLKPTVKGFGRVLDPAPLSAQLAQLATARVAVEASGKDLQRLRILHAQDQNVSTRAVEAAEAAVSRDQIAADAAHLAFVASWGQSIAGQPDLPGFVRSLALLETALVRVDLPLGAALKSAPTGGLITAVADEEKQTGARYLGPVPNADAQTQGQGFLFLLPGNQLPPGTAVTGWLSVSGADKSGVVVPRDAVLRHEGGGFVYVQISEELFLRQKIDLDHPLENGWFVNEGLKPGDKIVTAGAQQLLSEELKEWGGGE